MNIFVCASHYRDVHSTWHPNDPASLLIAAFDVTRKSQFGFDDAGETSYSMPYIGEVDGYRVLPPAPSLEAIRWLASRVLTAELAGCESTVVTIADEDDVVTAPSWACALDECLNGAEHAISRFLETAYAAPERHLVDTTVHRIALVSPGLAPECPDGASRIPKAAYDANRALACASAPEAHACDGCGELHMPHQLATHPGTGRLFCAACWESTFAYVPKEIFPD